MLRRLLSLAVLLALFVSAGTLGLQLRTDRQPRDFDHEIDATGWYLLPGFVNLHMHAGGPSKSPEAEYAYKYGWRTA